MDERHRQLPSAALAICAALAACALIAIAAGCGGGANDPKGEAADASGCKQVEAPKPKTVSFKAPKQTVRPGEELTAVIKTSCGSFDIALDSKHSPKTVNSFAFLAGKGFYDGLSFEHAAFDAFLEGGGSSAAGGGPGYTVKGEMPPDFHYAKGVVAMAQPAGAPPGAVGSPFFVVLAPYLDFPPIYPPLGRVDKGFGVLRRIAKLGPPASSAATLGYTGPVGKLRQPVLIEAVSIEKG